MQIVIDVDDNIYTRLFDCGTEMSKKDIENLTNAVRHGTPLPKGHGRLIDADALDIEREIDMADDWKTAHEIANCVKYAPTIIEEERSKE